MSVSNDMPIFPILLEIFHSKTQMSTSWWHYRKGQGSPISVGHILWAPGMFIQNFM